MSDTLPPLTKHELVLQKLREMTEELVRDEVVIPLLKKQGATHVEHSHGPFEKGKDLIYVHPDFHGHNRLEVCQVKNQPFSGKAGEGHVSTVLSQLIQCRKGEIRNPASGNVERPRGVLFLSTYDIPQKDAYGLGRLFLEIAENDIVVIGPEELVAKVEKFLPELFEDLAFPGGGIFGLLRRYVDTHHEAAAFGIAHQRPLTDFYVNLGMAQTGQVMASLVAGRAKPRSPKGAMIEEMAFEDLTGQFAALSQRLAGFDVFVLRQQAAELRKDAQQRQDQATNAKHVQIKEIQFEEFLRRSEAYVAAIRQHTHAATSASDDPEKKRVAEGIAFLSGCGAFVDSLSQTLKPEDQIVGQGNTKGFCFDLDQVPVEALLALGENVCLVGDAGAGKTSVARALVRVALDRNEPCVYFPCSRLDSAEKTLNPTILTFLHGLSNDRGLVKQVKLADVKWIILDGCDEAALPATVLNAAIQAIAFPKPLCVKLKKDRSSVAAFEVPQGLKERVKFDYATSKLVQYGPVSSFDWQRLFTLNEGSRFEVPLRDLKKLAKDGTPRLIVTTRDSLDLPVFGWMVRVRLAPLTDGQLTQFFERWFRDTPSDARHVIEFLDKTPHVKEVCRTPIVATLVAALHQSGVSLPLSKTDVYAKRFNLLVETWDAARGVALRNRMLPKDKMVFLQRLALRLHIKHRRVFTLDDAERVWGNGISRHYPQVKISDLVWELQLSNALIFSEGKDQWSLGHLSYQEYLAARAILAGQQIKLLIDNFHSLRWRPVILFYAGIAADLRPLMTSILKADLPVTTQGTFLQELIDEARYTPEDVRAFVEDVIETEEPELEFDDEVSFEQTSSDDDYDNDLYGADNEVWDK